MDFFFLITTSTLMPHIFPPVRNGTLKRVKFILSHTVFAHDSHDYVLTTHSIQSHWWAVSTYKCMTCNTKHGFKQFQLRKHWYLGSTWTGPQNGILCCKIIYFLLLFEWFLKLKEKTNQ